MENDNLKNEATNSVKGGGRRSIEVLPEEFLIMIANGKNLIHKDMVIAISEFGQVYYVNIKDGKRRRSLYCA